MCVLIDSEMEQSRVYIPILFLSHNLCFCDNKTPTKKIVADNLDIGILCVHRLQLFLITLLYL